MGMNRHMFAVALAATVSGCTTPSIRTAADTSALNIVSVSIDTSETDFDDGGRAVTRTPAQFEADLTAALMTELEPVSHSGGTPVEVKVKITQLRLAPPIERFVAGTSYLASLVSVVETGSGRVVVPETEVSGNTDNFRFVGLVGLVTTVSVEDDYRGTLRGYAKTVREALFGPQQ
jgi:hypothetical protein